MGLHDVYSFTYTYRQHLEKHSVDSNLRAMLYSLGIDYLINQIIKYLQIFTE